MRNSTANASKLAGFEQLATVDRDISSIGVEAERYVRSDPAACLMKLRLFAELVAKGAGSQSKIPRKTFETADAYLERLESKGILPSPISRLFHSIRIAGNGASHGKFARRDLAESALAQAKQLAVWYSQFSTVSQRLHSKEIGTVFSSSALSAVGAKIKATRAEALRDGNTKKRR
jgi:Domain of unknown function (DUF4145)